MKHTCAGLCLNGPSIWRPFCFLTMKHTGRVLFVRQKRIVGDFSAGNGGADASLSMKIALPHGSPCERITSRGSARRHWHGGGAGRNFRAFHLATVPGLARTIPDIFRHIFFGAGNCSEIPNNWKKSAGMGRGLKKTVPTCRLLAQRIENRTEKAFSPLPTSLPISLPTSRKSGPVRARVERFSVLYLL